MKSPEQEFKERVRSRIMLVMGVMLFINAYGTLGIYYIEKTSLLDAFYMAVVTLTTVGFEEVVPLSDTGRVFAITVIYLGLAGSGVSIAVITNLLFEETLGDFFKGRRMDKMLSKIEGHYIICGFGSTGRQIADELLSQGKELVVIDEKKTDADMPENCLLLSGDARMDEVLERAGVMRAAGLATTLTEDADNVFVVLTARALNPDLALASRYKDDDTRKKLYTAGVDYAVSPYRMGGLRLAHSMISPAVVDLIDATQASSEMGVRLSHISVPHTAPILGKTLRDSRLREVTNGILLVGVTDCRGASLFNPPPDFVFENIAQLLVLGDDEQIKALGEYLSKSA